MASKRQAVGRGKAVAGSSSGAGESLPGRAKRRDREEIARDNQAQWEASIKKRGAKVERHIIEDGGWPVNFAPFAAIRAQGMGYWFENNPGFNNNLVEEFYKHMIVPEVGQAMNPGARITSRIGNTACLITVDDIAAAWDYVRPAGPVNYPRLDNTFDDNEVINFLYTNRRDAKVPHWVGRFRADIRFLNQAVCYNLFPRGKEGAPSKYVGNLLYAFMDAETVCDWALYAFVQICDFRDAPITLRMPFPCLITKILRQRGIAGRRYMTNDEYRPGDMDSSILQRSRAQVRGAEPSLLTPPPPTASTKTWLEKIFGCVTGIARSQRKLKREQRQHARDLQDIMDRQRHMEARLAGQNPGPFQPRQWGELEVSDDFEDIVAEEGHSEAEAEEEED